MAAGAKTIVISDVHMSNGAKYSWFLPPSPGNVTAMLNNFRDDGSVEELVILGDLFDLWLYPLNVVPSTISQIIQANLLITEALRRCVQNIPNMYYIAGNHDMGVQQDDLRPFDYDGKRITLILPEDYNANPKYQNLRHFEHGHAVDMFNAPDDSGDTIGGYPLGYFITRLIATAEDQSAVWQALKGLIEGHAATHKAMGPAAFAIPSLGSYLVETIITLLEKLAQVHDNTPIRFSEPGLDERFTVGDIKNHYGSLSIRWLAQYLTEFPERMLVGFRSNGLNWYANKLLCENRALKVMLMGHTHHAEPAVAPQGSRYFNDGCWCIPGALGHGDPTPSYVEIIGDSAKVIPWL
jgi:predicted phosphodiesterase